MLLVDQGEAAPNAQAVGIGWREVEHYNGELTNHAWSLHYHDSYVREDGKWCIAKRELYCDWVERRPVRFLREGLDAQQ